jgi:PAS domain-containing protein
MEESLNKLLQNYGERVKELNCLYELSKLAENSNLSIEETLQRTNALLPPAWQYPDVACARIIFENQEFTTKNFKQTVWKQQSDIKVYGKITGAVEVYYLEEKPTIEEGPFLKEERKLIDAISERLGRILERKKLEKEKENKVTEIAKIMDSIGDLLFVMDADRRLVMVNKSTCDVFKKKPEELIGKHCYEIVHGTDKPWPDCPATKTFETKQTATGEVDDPHVGVCHY